MIVGAGPAGLTMANALAARGTSFVVLDQAAQGANTSRAAVVHARTRRSLLPHRVDAWVTTVSRE